MSTAYYVRLSLTHSYASPAGNGRHVLRVLPKSILGRQRVTAHLVEVFPDPAERFDGLDFFGNRTITVIHADRHDRMEIRMSARVEITPPAPPEPTFLDGGALAESLAQSRDLSSFSPLHFLGPSPRLAPNSEISGFAASLHRPDDSMSETVIRLGAALHDYMTFDPRATTVDTNAVDAFRQRRGVCQDYTHIMILALRSLGIPAGYVSGFLRTIPPKGEPRLEGADAMHAWVNAWCGPGQGWVEYDPTNACLPTTDHVVVGYGRDYADVSPIIGHLRASGALKSAQAVDVTELT